SPWEPYHVSKGFGVSDDAVTVFFTSGEWDISIQGHVDAQQLAAAIASFSGGTTAVDISPASEAARSSARLAGCCSCLRLTRFRSPRPDLPSRVWRSSCSTRARSRYRG